MKLGRPEAVWEKKLRTVLLIVFVVSLPVSVALQQTALGLLLALLAYSSWRNMQIPFSPLDWPLLVFFVTLLLSSLLSPSPLSSLFALRKLWLIGTFFTVYHLVQEPCEAWQLVRLMLIVTAGVAVYGIVQHFTGIDVDKQLLGKASDVIPLWLGNQGGFRTEGFFPTGITYAHNLCFPLILLTTRLSAPDLRWREGLLLGAGWGLMVFALLFSLTRGVWLAYLVVLGVLGLVKGGKGLVVVGGCTVFLALVLLNAGSWVHSRMNEVFNFAVNQNRHQIWQANIDMIKERPLFGWGYGNYKQFREPYYARYPAADTHAHAHNNFLQVWVDSGLVGLLAFLFLLWRILGSGWQAYHSLPVEEEPLRSLTLGGTLSLVGFLLGGLTQYNFGDAEVVIVFWTMTGILMRVSEWTREESQRISTPEVRLAAVAASKDH